MTDRKRVVVTGTGIVSGLGFDVSNMWTMMKAGKTGIHELTCFDTSDYSTKIGSEVDTEALLERLAALQFKKYDRTVDMAVVACEQALHHSGLIGDQPHYDPQDITTVMGTGAGSAHSLYASYMRFSERSVRGTRPTTVPRCMANATSAQISMKFRLTGPNYMVTCACASATVAIGTAFRMIKDGYADKVLCGGADAIFEPASYASWNNLGVMSRQPDPAKACKPFAEDRDGCVLGEGSAALLLESLDSAQERGVGILGEITGYGASSDAEHITRPNPEGQKRAIMDAMRSASLQPTDIDFINAHGTATRANDDCESISIAAAFAEHTQDTPVSANKPYFGHMLGASGAMESIVTLLCLQNDMIPPNLNLEKPDPNCNLHFVGNELLEMPLNYALKNSFGFGGTNAVLAMKKWRA